MNQGILIAFVVAVALISVVPGPDMMFVLAHAVSGGRRTGFVAAAGMSTGLTVHTVAAAFGLGALIRTAPLVLEGIRIAGALFLVYLAVMTWRASRGKGGSVRTPNKPRSLPRVYVMAVLTNLANPKVILFYLAFMPQFLTAGAHAWPVTAQFLVLGAIFIAIGIVVDSTVATLAGTFSEKVLRRQAFRRWLERASATIFGALAVRLVLDATQ